MDNRGLIERLRRDLTKSMFANATDMREDIEAQRRLAADALERAEAELAKRDRMLGEAVELIHEFSDHENRPCQHDHHGTCQEHPGAYDGNCPVAKSRAFLSAYDASKKWTDETEIFPGTSQSLANLSIKRKGEPHDD